MARGLAREGRRRLVGKPWLDGGLRCRTKEAAVGYFGMLRGAVLGSCLESSGRLEERKGLREPRGGRLKVRSGAGLVLTDGWKSLITSSVSFCVINLSARLIVFSLAWSC